MSRLIKLALAAAVVASLAMTAWVGSAVYGAGPLTKPAIVYVPKGAGIATVARDLEKDGVIKSARAMRYFVRFKSLTASLRAGEFEIPAGASLEDVLDALINGPIYMRKVTFPEGITSWKVVDILNNQSILTGTLEVLPKEGTLLPETYFYSRGDSKADVINRMQAAHKKLLTELAATHKIPAPLTNLDQVVNLAAIIEEESATHAEQRRVAGVFINRLKSGMRLQTDPTIMYGLTGGKPLGRTLTYADKRSQTPYNTYVIDGLPPTPIANPGADALRAAFEPERHNYLYFVADGKGGSVFASTLDQHNANVRAYLSWLKANKKGAIGGKMFQEVKPAS